MENDEFNGNIQKSQPQQPQQKLEGKVAKMIEKAEQRRMKRISRQKEVIFLGSLIHLFLIPRKRQFSAEIGIWNAESAIFLFVLESFFLLRTMIICVQHFLTKQDPYSRWRFKYNRYDKITTVGALIISCKFEMYYYR